MLRLLHRFSLRDLFQLRTVVAIFTCLNLVLCTYLVVTKVNKTFESDKDDSHGSNGLPLDVPKSKSGIPLVLHQVWTNVNVPVAFSSVMKTWVTNQGSWRKYFWEWKDVDKLVAATHPEFLEVFRSLPSHQMRLDIFKYMLMYRVGGVYADIDMQSLRPMDDVLDAHPCILPTHQHVVIAHNGVFTASVILLCRPGHPFFKKVVDYFIQLDPKLLRTNEDTGEQVFGRLATEYMNEIGTNPATGPQDALHFAQGDEFLPRTLIPRATLLETCMEKLTDDNVPVWIKNACVSLKTRDFNSFLPPAAYTDHRFAGMFEGDAGTKYNLNITIHVKDVYGKYYVIY
ncbi:uncharacterized protein LOC106153359 [Lingula anatina]|uniref:Uncharacterized protein LOC106153359 n=1 Tax=Lingula anatina TaxID=7574 RepID=A0A1S3H9M2_LINAN|nr:uncharacterized protein LOC106153359 [Lingula anatina]|eukprot:XP_013382708.1 uncharacterized protein LOC106153359 [Lingula anatina]